MKCLICDHETYEHHHPKFKMLFHVCPECEFIYKDIKNHPNEEQEWNQYQLHQNDITNQGYVDYLTDFVHQSVLPFVKHGLALDYGSGPNPVLSMLLAQQHGFNVHIYDPFYANNLNYLDYEYDLITSTEVIEHLVSPIDVFKTFNRLLKPKGILSLMTLFHSKDLNQMNGWFYIRDITHISFYTPKTILYIAEKTGFKVLWTNHKRQIVLMKEKTL
jgi:SAM-dependent methyltransferase